MGSIKIFPRRNSKTGIVEEIIVDYGNVEIRYKVTEEDKAIEILRFDDSGSRFSRTYLPQPIFNERKRRIKGICEENKILRRKIQERKKQLSLF